MRRIIFLLIICLLIISCSNPRKVKVSDPDALKYVKELCVELDSSEASALQARFKQVLLLHTLGRKGDYMIVSKYSKNYEDLEIGDLLNP